MPNIRSAMKHVRSDAKKRARNLTAVSQLKTLSQKLAALAGNPAEAEKIAAQAISRYDRAVSRGIIPRGKADRRKSRISKFLQKIKQK